MAEMAYRRRFLWEKYPHLESTEASPNSARKSQEVPEGVAEVFSVLQEIRNAGGTVPESTGDLEGPHAD